MRARNIKKRITIGIAFACAAAVTVFWGLAVFYNERSIVIDGNIRADNMPEEAEGGTLLVASDDNECADGVNDDGTKIRSIGVMLAGDSTVRPLSGIGQADIVIEMPVITGGINRFLAIFQCTDAPEIGSIRSARDDFIPVAAAFDAVYGHWGGSHFALDKLKKGVIDNIDALQNPYNAYFRKNGIASPNNGFSSLSRMRTAAEKKGYRMTQKEGYEYARLSESEEGAATGTTVSIGYPGQFGVSWIYDPVKKIYARSRGGREEIDKNTGLQVVASNVIVLSTSIKQIEGQYNDVRVTGDGEARIYRLGTEIVGKWKKDPNVLSSRILFVDGAGNEIPLAPGTTWLEYIDRTTQITVTPAT